jgi:hypothetical protein
MSQLTTADQVPWYLIILGAVLSITVVLLPLGIPIIIFGFLLVMRGLF